MNRTSIPLLALSVLTVAACQPQEAQEAAADTAYEAEQMVDRVAVGEALDALQDAYIAAYDAGDAAGLAATFASDGRLSPPLSPVLDLAGIEAAYAEQFAAGIPRQLEVMREDFIVDGDLVAAWGAYEVTMSPEGGEPFSVTGRYASLTRLQADGSLKILRHMFNYEVPPPDLAPNM